MKKNLDSVTVAIVEDNPDMLKVLERIIKQEAGFLYVGSASSGAEGIQLVSEWQPRVVLMDIYLGDRSGIDCVRELKPLCPNTDFVMCTAFTDNRLVYDALLAGANSYLMKNSEPELIIETIKEVSEGKSPMSSDIAQKIIEYIRKENKTPERNYGITPKEALVLELLAKGRTYQEVSDGSNISVKTLRTHIYRIYNKLQVNNRVEAINKFYNTGFNGQSI